jgi:hypothetical protein
MTTLTRETIQELAEKIKALDPIVAYMREQGFDPYKGCILVVPRKIWEDNGMPERPFVKKSDFIDQMYLVRPMEDLGAVQMKWPHGLEFETGFVVPKEAPA